MMDSEETEMLKFFCERELETFMLNRFFEIAAGDQKITMPHICVYITLLHLWGLNKFKNPIQARRSEVMRLAKINAKTTYHKSIHALQDGGYISYFPSFHPMGESQFFLL